MNELKRYSILGMMICLGFIVTLGGCKKSPDAQLIPTGVLLQSNGCKQFLSNASDQSAEFTPGQNDDCIEFQYNGTNTLVLRHINAGFNCCPGEITAEIDFNNSRVTITEREQEQGCKCLCLFDLDYEVVNLAPGEYTLRIIEPYVEEGDQALELSLPLFSTASGTHCVQRTDYPW
jgi:hypothetical protein